MCGVVGTILGIGMQVVGSIQQGRAQRDQYRYQQQINEQNAEVQKQRIEDAKIRGKMFADLHRQKVAGLEGTQKAVFAGNNVDISSATVEAFLEDTRTEGELDARIIENNHQREAYGYAVQEGQYRADADLAAFRGRSAQRQGFLGAGLALGQGIYSNWDDINNFFRPGSSLGSNITWFN